MLRRLSIAVSAVALMLLVFACQGEEAAPTPTPTPEPILTLGEILQEAGERLAAMSSAKFSMVDEQESGAKFFGMTFKSMEAEVEAPDSFTMLVDVESPAFGFVQVEMMAVSDQAFLKLSNDAPWAALPLEDVPFNFAGLGLTLRDLIAVLDGAALTGRESVGGAQAYRVEGSLASDRLLGLITTGDAGHSVSLTLWIDEEDFELRKIRIEGRIYDDDDPGTVRILDIHGMNVPVDIQLPDLGP